MRLEISTFRCSHCKALVDAVLGTVEKGSEMDAVVKQHMGDHQAVCPVRKANTNAP